MDVPLGTIKTWVHRARRALIDHLRRRGALPEPSIPRQHQPHFALATSTSH
jgi:hypothetical protein